MKIRERLTSVAHSSMNYYLTRDGDTFGPYEQESFPTMLQAGEITPDNLVCPEGGTEWVAISTLPELLNAPRKLTKGPPKLQLAAKSPGQAGSSQGTTFPQVTTPDPDPVERRSFLDRVEGFFGMLKNLMYLAGAAMIVFMLVAGFYVSQRDRREIEKLAFQPGWKEFKAANEKIDKENVESWAGNTPDAEQTAGNLTRLLAKVQKQAFSMEKGSGYSGGKLSRVAGAVDAMSAGTGKFQTFVDLRDDRTVVLIHVPEYLRYKGDAREAMRLLCVEAAEKAIPKPKSAGPVVVGIRGESGYDCVYIVVSGGARPTTGNVPSHQSLVKWFGPKKP